MFLSRHMVCVGTALAAFFLSACSKQVPVQLGDMDERAQHEGLFRIATRDSGDFLVTRFSTGGGRIVVMELSRSDPRRREVRLPAEFPLSEVMSISRFERQRGQTAVALALGSLFVLAVVVVATVTIDIP